MYAVFSPTVKPFGDGFVERRLPNLRFSTYSELNGLLNAVTLPSDRDMCGMIIYDSKSAFLALSSSRPAFDHVVQDTLRQLAIALDRAFLASILWVPSHV